MGIFAKVVLAIAILVANGVLLFVVLRFLLWLAFPGTVADAEPTAAGKVRRRCSRRCRHRAEVVARPPPSPATARAAASPAPTTGAPPVFAALTGPRPRAYPHRLLIGLPVILALFAGGVWLGSVVGGSGGGRRGHPHAPRDRQR